MFEECLEGEAMRIMLVGEHAWQVGLTGDGPLRSMHHPDAAFSEFRELHPNLLVGWASRDEVELWEGSPA